MLIIIIQMLWSAKHTFTTHKLTTETILIVQKYFFTLFLA